MLLQVSILTMTSYSSLRTREEEMSPPTCSYIR